MTPETVKGDGWYSHESVGDGVTLILENHHDPEWRCNIWHVRGRDRDLVIDTGLGLKPLAAEIAAIAERPAVGLCTHCHYDHSGALHEFDERLAHRAEAEAYAHPDRANIVAENFFVDAMVYQAPYPGFDAEAWCIEAAPLTRELDDGDVVDLGDRVLRVLHVPGHSPGSIALWEEETGILFSGDTVYDGGLIDDLYHSVPEELVESHARLLELPIRIVHGGHYASFGKDRLALIAEEYRAGQRRWGCPVPG
ncbi:MAG: MBL fold metallo-hydrolase [Rhodospirillales bacterium]